MGESFAGRTSGWIVPAPIPCGGLPDGILVAFIRLSPVLGEAGTRGRAVTPSMCVGTSGMSRN